MQIISIQAINILSDCQKCLVEPLRVWVSRPAPAEVITACGIVTLIRREHRQVSVLPAEVITACGIVTC